jgi:hypothetical protein
MASVIYRDEISEVVHGNCLVAPRISLQRVSACDLPLPTTDSEWLERARMQSARFWSKMDRSDNGACWAWLAGKDSGGYGKFQITGRGPRFLGDHPIQKHVRAHRLAYELTHGLVNQELVMRHRCDNPPCCNPAHLEPGTQKQNRQDAVQRGREPRGVQKTIAKIDESTVAEIRRLRESGLGPIKIAQELGLTSGIVCGVYYGRTWRHVS